MNIKTVPINKAKLLIATPKGCGYPASLSGDGKTVIFPGPKHKKGLYRLKDDNPAVEQIAKGICAWSDVSFDGDTVVFSTFGDGSDSIHRWTPQETELLAEGPGLSKPVDLSDDGKSAAWEDLHIGSDYEKFYWSDAYLQKNGEKTAKLSGPNKGDNAKISGDGQHVFWRETPSGNEASRIWVDSPSAPPRALDLPEFSVHNFEVDDSGETIAFIASESASDSGEPGLYLHSLKTGTTMEISTDPLVDEGDPCVSGDGSTVAYSATHGAGDIRIRVYKDGRNFELASPHGGYHTKPRLSDDGNTLMWSHAGWGNDVRSLFKMDLSGLN